MIKTAREDAPDIRQMIAANLDAELARQRWTKRKAAAALHLSPVYVTRRTSGEVELTGSDLAMFADFLKIPVSRFFQKLPDQDSNLEPAGFSLGRPLVDLDRARALRKQTPRSSTPTHQVATVTPITAAI